MGPGLARLPLRSGGRESSKSAPGIVGMTSPSKVIPGGARDNEPSAAQLIRAWSAPPSAYSIWWMKEPPEKSRKLSLKLELPTSFFTNMDTMDFSNRERLLKVCWQQV